MTPLFWLLAGLAAARTWRLFAIDGAGNIVRKIAHRAIFAIDNGSSGEGRRYRIANSLLEGFYCAYCLPFWITGAWVGSGLLWSESWLWQLAAGSFGVSYAVSHALARLDNEDTKFAKIDGDLDGEVGEAQSLGCTDCGDHDD